MSIFSHLGKYYILMLQAFAKPDKFKVVWRRVIDEMLAIGVGSIPIVAILSVFMGAVTLLQMAYNFTNPLVPSYTEGLATRDTMILEFAPTIISLILAGKVGSNIASEI